MLSLQIIFDSYYFLASGGADGASTVLCVIEYAKHTLSVPDAYAHRTAIGSIPFPIALSMFFDMSVFSAIDIMYTVKHTIDNATINAPTLNIVVKGILNILFISFSFVLIEDVSTNFRSFCNISPSWINIVCMVE